MSDSEGMKRILALPETSFASQSESTFNREADFYKQNLKFLQQHGVFSSSSAKLSTYFHMKREAQRVEEEKDPSQNFSIVYDILTKKQLVQKLKEESNPDDLKIQRLIAEMEVEVHLKEKILEKNQNCRKRLKEIELERKIKLQDQAVKREIKKELAESHREEMMKHKSEKLMSTMKRINEGIKRSVDRKKRIQERRKMEWKKGNMKKHHDILYNKINIEAERIDYEEEIKKDFQATMQRQNKIAEINREKAESVNIANQQRTQQYREYRESQMVDIEEAKELMVKRENRKKTSLKNRLVQDKTLLNWTLGSSGSGARLRSSNWEVVNEAKRIVAKRESVASRLNRLERSGSPYKKSGMQIQKSQAQRGSIILLQAGATPKRGQRSLEPSKRNSMNLIDLEKNKGRLKRTITLTNQEEMKEFSEHAALSRMDYMLKKLQDKERKITELDYEYRKENQFNIFSKLSHSSSRNSSRKRGALSPIESHRDSIFDLPADKALREQFTPPRDMRNED